MKYSKKLKKKIPKKKTKVRKYTNKKKYKKKLKKFKGGAALNPDELQQQILARLPPAPPPVHLTLQPSGAPLTDIQENLQRLFTFLEENPQCKTMSNCVPTALELISKKGIDPEVLKKWITGLKETGLGLSTLATNRTTYLRNFSSRYPLEGESGEQMWTDEPLIDFMSNLIKTGIHLKDDYDPTNPNHISSEGCIHVSLNRPYPSAGHSFLFCLQGDKNFIIDPQTAYQGDLGKADPNIGKADPNKAIIGPDRDALLKFFEDYTPNSFFIHTRQTNKSSLINNIVQKRLEAVSINWPLIGGSAIDHGPLTPLPYRLSMKILRDMKTITPAVLADPSSSGIDQIPTDLVPLIFNFTNRKDEIWPAAVAAVANKYSKFQNNNYSPDIRMAALTAILKAKTDNQLEQLLDSPTPSAPPAPTQTPTPSAPVLTARPVPTRQQLDPLLIPHNSQGITPAVVRSSAGLILPPDHISDSMRRPASMRSRGRYHPHASLLNPSLRGKPPQPPSSYEDLQAAQTQKPAPRPEQTQKPAPRPEQTQKIKSLNTTKSRLPSRRQLVQREFFHPEWSKRRPAPSALSKFR